MANNDFKVGDRVTVYGWRYPKTEPVRGIVVSVQDGLLKVNGDGQAHTMIDVHPRQCRRLKPKKRREFRLKYSGGAKHFVECKHPCTPADCLGCILVREVNRAQKAEEK